MNRIIFTDIELEKETHKQTFSLWGLLSDERLEDLRCFSKDHVSLVGNIYVGRVVRVDYNLNAAYISYADGKDCFTSLKYLDRAIFTNKVSRKEIGGGDEVLIQIERDAIKSKIPGATFDLTFHSGHALITRGNLTKSISSKIKGEMRKELQDFLEQSFGLESDFGIVLRTNCVNINKEELSFEINELLLSARNMLEHCVYKAAHSLLHESEREEIAYIKKLSNVSIDEIVTDSKEIYESILSFSDTAKNLKNKIRFYDDSYSLVNLYGLKTKLSQATSKVVHLKSGAQLVIEATEAMTVIDVNSGKIQKKKAAQDFYLNVNLEAAREIARQMRIRNLSGIIIVDFISMKQTDTNRLFKELKEILKEDSISAQAVDITKLGLIEITRKKVSRTLAQELALGFYDNEKKA
ncbi:ribonuclease E/G [Eubacterium oxidoreducens]|uniref:Ribonuclease G n=1 Tax=Eubacterium oxidoreducens TaxID=1732 RepID=A0A1G6AM20_EUBOX|nr:ribonuclease E/G [Eubacterium oxidoreducens]SDB09410.1 ribonuclease G [Eubacterium oxidoreducens]